MRIFPDCDPFVSLDYENVTFHRGFWPVTWICVPGDPKPPFVSAYRNRFTLPKSVSVIAHVSADERYELFLDGRRIGRGSERGDRENWYYESYQLDLTAGEHTIVARVWSLGDLAPYAQMTIRPGFIFAVEGETHETLSTGIAQWEAKQLGGYDFPMPTTVFGTGSNVKIDGSKFEWGWETGSGGGWQPAETLHQGTNGPRRNETHLLHFMRRGTLPLMFEEDVKGGTTRFVQEVTSDETASLPIVSEQCLASEIESWNMLKSGGGLVIPANTKTRAIIDLEDYYCAYPEVVTTGGCGSQIRIQWAEALYESPQGGAKGNRDEVEGKYFIGVGDIFCPDGGKSRRFDTLWWKSGRYLEVYVETADEPLIIEKLKLRQTHYPFDYAYNFESSDTRLGDVIPIAMRGLEMCAHETYMDCPYYEQLQYVGDTRLEVLTTYVTTPDSRLPRKAIRMFDASRLNNGLTYSRYPSRVRQVIPPFSLWWVGMIRDWAYWKDDQEFLKSCLPGMRGVLDHYLSCRTKDGLVGAPLGWNYLDWVPDWPLGIPPDGDWGVNGSLNWKVVLAFKYAAEVEESVGETELAARARRIASELATSIRSAFWDKGRNLFADDLAHTRYSEHAQCLAILSGELADQEIEAMTKPLLEDTDLARTTIYFTHYLFETYALLGRMDKLFERMELWFSLKGLGFKTTLEHPEPSRSDCHAWGAHPVYHYFATIMGIRPASAGFRTVTVHPQLGHLEWVNGKMPHPKGCIEADLKLYDGKLTGSIVLPDGVSGSFDFANEVKPLSPGVNTI